MCVCVRACVHACVRVCESRAIRSNNYNYFGRNVHISWPKRPYFLAETSLFLGRNVHFSWPKRPCFLAKKYGRNGSWPKCPVTVTNTVVAKTKKKVATHNDHQGVLTTPHDNMSHDTQHGEERNRKSVSILLPLSLVTKSF